MNILNELKDRFRAAVQAVGGDTAAALALIRPAQDARFGDYQANCAMPLGKQVGSPPKAVAQQIVSQLQLADLCHPPEIAGPGFINLRLRDEWLADQLSHLEPDPRLGVPLAQARTFVVDYSSPNVAKSMHVGHIRSTVIGDALARILRFLGHHVIADNHLGDWGTQFGMIIYGYRHFLDPQAYQSQPLAELGRVYQVVRAIMDNVDAVRAEVAFKLEGRDRIRQERDQARAATEAEPNNKQAAKAYKRAEQKLAEAERQQTARLDKIASVGADADKLAVYQQHAEIHQAVLQETARLHEGDAESLALWREVLPKCRDEVQRIYERLDIQFDVELGESFYHDRLPGVVDDLVQRGLARESEGAICVFLDDFKAPMIVQKNDGAYLYATTDLATIQYRLQQWAPDAILYVVDFRQGEHFQKLFAVARRCGYDQVELRHIEFGTVLGEDGRPFRTRAGDTVGLESLLDAAVQRARQVVSENDDAKKNGPELSDAERAHIADVVGHAAIKYADLSQNRTSDYVFSEEKMVALKGNTATYLQYSYARAMNILSKSGQPELEATSTPLRVEHEKERQLALTLLRFPEACDEVLVDYRPNQLTGYLYSVASSFAEFYEACPVLKAETPEQQHYRLRLCQLVARTLKLGLSLLGIQVVDKM